MATIHNLLSRVGPLKKSSKIGSMMGWIAEKGMDKSNAPMAREMVRLSGVKPEAIIVELGPGSGYVSDELLQTKNPKKIYGVNISEDSIGQLEKKFPNETRLSFHKDDARHLPFIKDSSVDCVYGMNTIYFLDPLQDYMTEVHRILKPGGTMLWGVTDAVKEVAEETKNEQYMNTDWQKCIAAMEESNFDNITVDETEKDKFPFPVFIKANKPLSEN